MGVARAVLGLVLLGLAMLACQQMVSSNEDTRAVRPAPMLGDSTRAIPPGCKWVWSPAKGDSIRECPDPRPPKPPGAS